MSDGGAGAAPARPCPICGSPAVAAHRPFCSKRCANIDLGRWLGERYRVETEEQPDTAAGEGGEGSPGSGKS
jgi:hypothetical protein